MFAATTLNGVPGGNVSATFVQPTGSDTCTVAAEAAGASAGNELAGGNTGWTGSGRSRGSKGSITTDAGSVGVGLGVTTGVDVGLGVATGVGVGVGVVTGVDVGVGVGVATGVGVDVGVGVAIGDGIGGGGG